VSRVPVTYEHCEHIPGPFYHGTNAVLEVGDELVPGRNSNFQPGRISNNIYFTAVVETAAWGAELSTALARAGMVAGPAGSAEAGTKQGRARGTAAETETATDERGHIYVVQPLGPFEDDPNVTDKKFPGNPTESYRTRHALRVVGEVSEWTRHPPEVLAQMLANLARLREQGLDLIED